MTESLSLNRNADSTLPPQAPRAASRGKVYFSVSPSEWVWNVIFMLSLSLTGLAMPLGNLLVVILLLRAFKVNREAFVFMLMLTLGGYALTEPKYQWGVNHMFFMVPFAILSMCVLRKSAPVKQTIIAYGVFAVITVGMCVLYGVESLYTQLRPMLLYLSFCFFAIPLLAFSGEGFDMHRFWNTVFSFMMIMCVFYILDGFVVRGWLFVPCSWINYEGTLSLWNHPIIYGPTGWIPRKYPPGLYSFALLLYPMAKYYKLKWWQWLLVIGAMCASRTSTILFSLVFGFILAQGSMKRYALYGILAAAVFTGLYFVDDAMGYSAETEQSTMRISSTINQFFDLSEAEDDEDLAEAGTGRMAQAIPSLEYIFSVGREWTGFGFVDPDTKIPFLIVENELVANPEFKYQAVNNVEITQVKEFLTLGFIGLAVWFGFIFGICRILRGMRYARYYTNVAIVLMLYGVGGFDSWFNFPGILIGAMAFASVLLANKPQSLEEYPGELPS